MAQVQESIEWLERAAETGKPKFAASFDDDRNKAAWASRLKDLRAAAAKLLASGGADYDGKRVRAGARLAAAGGSA